jgi:hypothetical protein
VSQFELNHASIVYPNRKKQVKLKRGGCKNNQNQKYYAAESMQVVAKDYILFY